MKHHSSPEHWSTEEWHEYVTETGTIRYRATLIREFCRPFQSASELARQFIIRMGVDEAAAKALSIEEVGEAYSYILAKIQPLLQKAAEQCPSIHDSYRAAFIGIPRTPAMRLAGLFAGIDERKAAQATLASVLPDRNSSQMFWYPPFKSNTKGKQ
jgi:hypothetical protein